MQNHGIQYNTYIYNILNINWSSVASIENIFEMPILKKGMPE